MQTVGLLQEKCMNIKTFQVLWWAAHMKHTMYQHSHNLWLYIQVHLADPSLAWFLDEKLQSHNNVN